MIFGFDKHKIGKICKNLFDMARIDYLKRTIALPPDLKMEVEMFYYVERDVTLENTMIVMDLKRF
jgi:hypothetical protein